MSLERDIEQDLAEVDGNKVKLVEKYAKRMAEIQKFHGGNISDIPVNSDNEYNQINQKLRAIHRM